MSTATHNADRPLIQSVAQAFGLNPDRVGYRSYRDAHWAWYRLVDGDGFATPVDLVGSLADQNLFYDTLAAHDKKA